jgi:Bacterial archaeo-eukaryotic release factor family 11
VLYIDVPSLSEFMALAAIRGDICVSLYLRATPLTEDVGAARMELKNLLNVALEKLRRGGADRCGMAAVEELVDDLIDDDEFWRFQANSLAILANPEALRTFRLPNHFQPLAEVSDRFHLTPLLRTLTLPNEAFVLALSQVSVRLLQVFTDLPPRKIRVDGLPEDASTFLHKAPVQGRSPSGRTQGSEDQKTLLRHYTRQVDQALRGILAGRHTPLILVAESPLEAIYRSVNTYPHLVTNMSPVSINNMSEQELAEQARSVLDQLHADEVDALVSQYKCHNDGGRVTTDIATAARAATFGAIEALMVDVNEIILGTVNETDGRVTFGQGAGPKTYGIVDEIARRALRSGARVLGLRKDDIPERASLAAIMRYPFV